MGPLQLGAPIGFLRQWVVPVDRHGVERSGICGVGMAIPFLASAILIGLGLWVRLKINETPEFVQALAHESPIPIPIGELVRNHALATFAGTFAVVACFAFFTFDRFRASPWHDRPGI